MRSIRTFWTIVFLSMAAVPIILIITDVAEGAEFLKPRNLSWGLGSYTSKATRDAYLNTPETGPLVGKMDLQWDVDLVCGFGKELCLFMDNIIDSKASENRFRYVSWNYNIGLDMGKIQVSYWHKSEHMFESEPNPTLFSQSTNKFPVQDSIMIRFFFIRGGL